MYIVLTGFLGIKSLKVHLDWVVGMVRVLLVFIEIEGWYRCRLFLVLDIRTQVLLSEWFNARILLCSILVIRLLLLLLSIRGPIYLLIRLIAVN